MKAFISAWYHTASDIIIQPRNERIVVRRHPEQQKGVIATPEIAAGKSQRGTILAVGPGKWHEGEWWLIKGKWEWIPAWREPMTVRPGMEVCFSSKWNDLAHDRFDDLPVGADPYIHLLQEADVLAILG